MFESYKFQMETIIGQYTIKIYDNFDYLILNIMGNHNPKAESPFGVPYFGLSLKDYSNMDDESYIPREFKFCRISMLEPKILGIEDENFIPSKEHIELLYNWFKSQYNYINHDNKSIPLNTGWEQLIYEMSTEPYSYNVPIDLQMPNYLELKL